MTTNRLEAFSDGVIAIPFSFVNSWIAMSLYAAVAVVWLVPDRRIACELLKRTLEAMPPPT